MHQSTAHRICFRLKWKKISVWVETQCNRACRRDSIACINQQLSGYASDLNGKNLVCGWRHSVIELIEGMSIACINLQLSGYASDLNGKNVECGWRHSVIEQI